MDSVKILIEQLKLRYYNKKYKDLIIEMEEKENTPEYPKLSLQIDMIYKKILEGNLRIAILYNDRLAIYYWTSRLQSYFYD